MTIDFQKIAQKWQKKWDEDKLFEVEAKDKPKCFITVPYPYVNGLLHIGHTYTFMRAEAFARYKKMQGFNTLFAVGLHATGTPIVTAAKRVKEKEEKQIRALKLMGYKDEDIPAFEDPLHWVHTFSKELKTDVANYGLSVDLRRTFVTTDLNPHYDKFIRWQFNKLHEKGYVKKSKHPVVWCPSCKDPTGDHARSEGEGEGPKDFIWIKFKLQDSDLILMAGTTRPDALYAERTLWVDPSATYHIVNVEGEKWVVGKEAKEKIEQHALKYKEEGTIKAEELIGKKVHGAVTDQLLYILPASFIKADMGSGLVYSALEDPFDYMEMKHIQESEEIIKKYNLDAEEMKKIQPISIISLEGFGDDIGKEMCEKFKIKSYENTQKLEEAKAETNKLVFRKGIMKDNCGECAGLTVPKAQEKIKKILIENGNGVMFYELTGKVVCRCLTECIVKIVDDQWFLSYGDEKWKKITHKAVDKVKLYPEKVRSQFDYVLDWLRDWACTREFGLGTNLPWEEKWKIESLSDSTIYPIFFTIFHKIKEIPAEQLDDNFFDYVLYDKDVPIKVDKEKADEMKKEFNYWYPLDFYNSGKDLVQNHFAFYLFNHTALFEEKYWPKGIGVNGYVNINKEKMSKSKGNFKTLRDLINAFGADVVRIGILATGEELNDVDWDSDLAETMKTRLQKWYEFAIEHYGKGEEKKNQIDEWMEHQLHTSIKLSTEGMEETLFRTAITKGFFDLQRHLKWYERRTAGKMNKELLKELIEAQTSLLHPFAPHICEEIWEKIGKKDAISTQWPKYDENKIKPELDELEAVMSRSLEDIAHVLKLAKIEKPKKITFFIAEQWKADLFKQLQEILKETRDFKEIMQKASEKEKLSKEAAGLVQKIAKNPSKLIEHVSTQEVEYKNMVDAVPFLEKQFGCSVEMIKEQDSGEKKASQALPGKPALLVE